MNQQVPINNQDKEIDGSDKPSKVDYFGREPFIEAIVKTIESSSSGFNLGISARWGEGKSTILEQLQPKLEKLNYKILKFEPWKYTQDKISIKRKFLIDIHSQLGVTLAKAELYSTTEKENDLDDEEQDRQFSNRFGVFFKYSALFSILFLLILCFLKFLVGLKFSITQIFLTNLFIPVFTGLLPIIQKITEIRIKQVTPKVESAEQFEDLFNKAITDIMGGTKPPKHIIIFVDDLDRCNNIEVEQILTALFTFFNNKNCTYIITADHTVIRRYISNFLHLDGEVDIDGNNDIRKTNEIKHKEATEYLKKIFQINFIVPKITNDLLRDWIKKLVHSKEAKIISNNFINPYAEVYFVELALNNFESNPRKIKHFIRTLSFQLIAVDEKIKILSEAQKDEKENLLKVLRSPELLGKILIIQDRFPDYYEKLVAQPKFIQKIELGEKIEEIDNKELLYLLAQEPKFFNSTTRSYPNQDIDPYYFLYFSGSTGFVENSAIDPNEVKALARSANFEVLKKNILTLTDVARNIQIKHINDEFNSPQIQLPEKTNIIRSLIQVICLLEQPELRLNKLKEIINSPPYKEQIKALQSVDVESFMPFIDVAIADKLLNEEPFNTPEMQSFISNAFISCQDILTDELANKFIEAIANRIIPTDDSLPNILNLVNRLSSKSIKNSTILQDKLLQALEPAKDGNKQSLLDTIIQKKSDFDNSFQEKFENIVSNTIISGSEADAFVYLNTIPNKINAITISKLTKSIAERIKASNNDEFNKLASLVFDSKVKPELEKADYKLLIETIIEKTTNGTVISDVNINTQLVETFITSQDDINGAIANKFIESIAEKVKLNDATSLPALATIKRLSKRRIQASNNFQNELVDNLKLLQGKGAIWQELVLTIIHLKNNLNSSNQYKFEEDILEILTSGNIADLLFFLSNIPKTINSNNFNFSKLLKALNKQIKNINGNDVDPLIKALLNPQIISIFNKSDFEDFLLTIINQLDNKDEAKFNAILLGLSDILTFSNKKESILDKLISFISATEDFSRAQKVNNFLGSIKEFWSSNVNMKEKFVKNLQRELRYISNPEIKKSTSELVDLLDVKENDEPKESSSENK